MAAVLPPGANCIDIGANVGDVLGMMVRLAPAGHHIAYEPLPELAGSLAERFPGVDVRNAAVWETSGEATFYRDTVSDSRSCPPAQRELRALHGAPRRPRPGPAGGIPRRTS